MSKFDERLPQHVAKRFLDQAIGDLNVVTDSLLHGSVVPLLYPAGSYRRSVDGGHDDIGDIDLIVTLPDGMDLHDVHTPGYLKVTPKKAFGWLTIGDRRMNIDAWLCPLEARGPFGFFLTGPPELNIVMRQVSQQAGLMLTQYGLFEPVPAPTKTYPDRVKPGRRVDRPTPEPRTSLEHCEMQFWADWLSAVWPGVEERAFPFPRERREVTSWLQARSRAMRSAATSPG